MLLCLSLYFLVLFIWESVLAFHRYGQTNRAHFNDDDKRSILDFSMAVPLLHNCTICSNCRRYNSNFRTIKIRTIEWEYVQLIVNGGFREREIWFLTSFAYSNSQTITDEQLDFSRIESHRKIVYTQFQIAQIINSKQNNCLFFHSLMKSLQKSFSSCFLILIKVWFWRSHQPTSQWYIK